MRTLGDLFQEFVCFSHDPQGDLRDSQTSLRDRKLPAETRDLGLFRRQPADLLARVPARENTGIAKFAPLGDLGRVDTFLAEIRAALVAEDRVFVAREEVQFLGRGECSSRPGPAVREVELVLVIGLSSRRADRDELDMIGFSWFSPYIRRWTCSEVLASSNPDT